ncbi:MAG: hypothetical protein ACR2J4_02145 [Deinococcus sp.]
MTCWRSFPGQALAGDGKHPRLTLRCRVGRVELKGTSEIITV